MDNLPQKIAQTLALIDIHPHDEQLRQLAAYIDLLDKWNKAFNLSAIRNKDEMLDRHLLDSLSIAPHLIGENFIDVGTGAGLPGIPLAILYPQKTFCLLDSNGKKVRFLQQVKIELGLKNITVVKSRVELFQVAEKFDGVLSRAFATLADMLEGAKHLCKQEGYFFAMKGIYPQAELDAINKEYKVLELNWPNNTSARHLVVIQQ